MSWQFENLSSTWTYFNQIINSISPTVTVIYDNWLTNPIFMALLLVLIILSVFTFSD